MKKRIISFILVIVMAVLSLASCAYSYKNDDMSKYAKFDEEEFARLLQDLKIDDADFGTDEDARWLKVADKIYEQLAKEVDKEENKKTTGTPGKYDLYKYCYYASYTDKDGNEIIVFASKMKESGATELQLGLSKLADLNEKIANAVKDLELKEGAVYSTDTSAETKTALGNTIVISYKEAYTKPTSNGSTEKVTNTVTNMIVTLPAVAPAEGANKTFLDQLVGLAVGSKNNITEYRDINGDGNVVTEGDGAEKVEYTDVKIDWVIKSGVNEYHESGITVTDKTYTATKSEKDVTGVSRDLKDVELTYHIFPVSFVTIEEDVTAEVILETLIGDAIQAPNDKDGDGVIKEEKDTNENGKIDEDEKSEEYAGSLDVFHDKDYVYHDKDDATKTEKISDIVKKLVEFYETLADKTEDFDEKQKAYDDAKKVVDDKEKDGGTPTKEQTDALAAAKTNLDEATKAKEKAEKDVADQIAKILACTKEGDTEGGIAEVIKTQYKDSVYEGLEDEYKAAIKKNLAKEIYAAAKKLVSFEKDEKGWWILPRAAVDAAYKRILNNFKYTFYEGSYTSTQSNYSKYNGDFYEFLKKDTQNGLGLKDGATMQDIYNEIGKRAEDSVKDTILVYVLADVYGADVEVTAEDIEEFKTSYYYFLLQYSLGYGSEVNSEYYMTSLQLNNVFNHLLEEDETVEGNEVKYLKVKYTFNEKK